MLISLLSVSALAAGSITWTKNTKLTAKVNKYSDATVNPGITVTLADSGNVNEPTGLWITHCGKAV